MQDLHARASVLGWRPSMEESTIEALERFLINEEIYYRAKKLGWKDPYVKSNPRKLFYYANTIGDYMERFRILCRLLNFYCGSGIWAPSSMTVGSKQVDSYWRQYGHLRHEYFADRYSILLKFFEKCITTRKQLYSDAISIYNSLYKFRPVVVRHVRGYSVMQHDIKHIRISPVRCGAFSDLVGEMVEKDQKLLDRLKHERNKSKNDYYEVLVSLLENIIPRDAAMIVITYRNLIPNN